MSEVLFYHLTESTLYDALPALVGLVDALNLQGSLGPAGAQDDGVDISEKYLERARALAPDSALVARAAPKGSSEPFLPGITRMPV